MGWVTSGRGDTDAETVFERSEPGGELEPDVPLVATFHVRLPPEGPVTYHGTLLSVDWFVDVELDIPWRFDPKRRAAFAVVPRVVEAPPSDSK